MKSLTSGRWHRLDRVSRGAVFLSLIAILFSTEVFAQPPSHDPATMIQDEEGRY